MMKVILQKWWILLSRLMQTRTYTFFRVIQVSAHIIRGLAPLAVATILKSIFGLVMPREGHVFYDGRRVEKVPASKMPGLGVCFVPQGRRTFPNLTVEENLELGAFIRDDDISEDMRKVFHMFPVLKDKRKDLSRTLSGGQQQMLAIARALMLNPKVLMLDEPSLGLSPGNKELIFNKIKEIRESGTTIIIVEQNARMALDVADRAYVLENGKISFSGNAKELAKDNRLKEIYLG